MADDHHLSSTTIKGSPGGAARLAIAVLAGLLLLLNAAGWWLALRLIRAQEDFVVRSLEQSAEYIASLVSPGDLYFLEIAWDSSTGVTDFATLSEYAEVPSVKAFQEAIARTSGRLGENLDIALVSPDGYLVADSQGFHTEAVHPARFEVDEALIRSAAAGVAGSNRDQKSDPVKRAWQPLRGESGNVVGLLRLEDRSMGEFPRTRIIRRLTLGSLLATVLIISLWWSLSRLVGRAVRAERSAIQGDRLRALGTATAGIAHEIRNPLGIILLMGEELDVCARKVADEQERDALVRLSSDLREEARRLSRLTDDFLALAKDQPDETSPTPVDIRRCCEQTARLFSRGLPPDVKIETTLPENRIDVLLSEARLRQVLLNLLRNANEAAPSGKPLRIQFSLATRKHHALIEITDNGPGMDAATLSHVFDPFFTTRSDGTGLGLSVSRSLLESVGGSLELESQPGEGCTARVALPRAEFRLSAGSVPTVASETCDRHVGSAEL